MDLVPTRLGKVLRKVEDWIVLDPETTYREVTVRVNGKGIVPRGKRQGMEIGSDRRLRVRSGQFIISRIDARHGASGIIPEELDGAVVTNDFPVFNLDQDELDSRYLHWLSKTTGFVDACRKASEGTTNRVRLREDRFYNIEVDLPPLPEQQRIVAKIDAVAVRLDEANRLRQEIQEDMEALVVAMAHRNDLSGDQKRAEVWRKVRLGEVLRQSFDAVEVVPGQEYPHFGVFSFAKGLFKKAPLPGDQIKAERLYRVSTGQFVYGRLNAYEGAFGIVSDDLDGSFVSNEFPIFSCNREHVLPEFLLAYFSSPAIWEHLKRQVTGIGGGAGNRRIRLRESVFLSHSLWLPPLEWQQKISVVSENLKETARVRSETAAELDALLPAVLDKAFRGEL